MGRIGEPEEVASAIVFLLSDEASYINSSELLIDGGYPPLVGPEKRRPLRAVMVLERIGTAHARRVLAKLAQGATGHTITDQASGSLGRLRARSQ